MIAFSLLYEKRSPAVCVWKVFQDNLLPGFPQFPCLQITGVLSWGVYPDQKSTPGFYSLGSSTLGVIATTSVPLRIPPPVIPQTSGLWFLCISSGKAQSS